MFLEAHGDLPMDGNSWDALKAYLRGALRSKIAYIKKTNRQEEEELAEKCVQAEIEYIGDPSRSNKERWEKCIQLYKIQAKVNAKRRFFFRNQQNYEQGNQARKLLAHMVKQQSTSLAVSKIRNTAGELVYAMDEIIKCLNEFYVSMYRTRLTCTDREMEQYMNKIEYPKLTEE